MYMYIHIKSHAYAATYERRLATTPGSVSDYKGLGTIFQLSQLTAIDAVNRDTQYIVLFHGIIVN
eukprot:m.116507 g.116507  ORF g.116507 m.116507 type:complete len:65 (-) comp13613_c0_seq2:1015-1209(-)